MLAPPSGRAYARPGGFHRKNEIFSPKTFSAMAYVRLEKLEQLGDPNDPQFVAGSDGRLQECTPEEVVDPAYFSAEDIIRITNQTDFHSIKKLKARFWGRKHQVWVGYKQDGNLLTGVIALQCPPYYKPHAFPGVDVSEVSVAPEGFPTQATLPAELS
jgi:hypothetical protein